MEKKKFNQEDKMMILKEAEQEGVELTIRKHGVYVYAVFATA